MTAATEMWWDLGDSYQARQAAVVATACPHCHAAAGVQCRTPNGWAALHRARINVAAGHVRSASTSTTADNHDRQGTLDKYAEEHVRPYFDGDVATSTERNRP